MDALEGWSCVKHLHQVKRRARTQAHPRSSQAEQPMRASLNRFFKTALESLENRVELFGAVTKDAHRMIQAAHDEQERLLGVLKENLAKNCSLRRKDFDLVVDRSGIAAQMEPDRLLPLLERLESEARALCEELRREQNARSRGFQARKAICKQALSRLAETEREALRLIRGAQLFQQELREALGRLVLKGDGVQLQDLQRVFQSYQLRREAGRSLLGTVLEDWDRLRTESNMRWSNMLGNKVGGITQNEEAAP